ncbi:MAG: NAD-dependent epimerase/dehydratase family protein [Anaerolineaceae bacterium]
MKILILGGTRFLGRALVEKALACGHELTLFNRGISNPSLYPQVRQIHGDRSSDLNLLQNDHWDAVIDTCGYIPRVVRETALALQKNVGFYTFVSTISVYVSPLPPRIGESAPLIQLADPTTEEITGETYGGLKASCEGEVMRVYAGNSLIIRPGLIVGPNDPTDRFTYWVNRAAAGEEILCPGRPDRLVEWIDVRDLAAWMIRMVEQTQSGIFNATGPSTPMRDLIEAAVEVSQPPSTLTWISDDFLLSQQVEPWTDLPLWIPDDDPESTTICNTNCDRAVQKGLSFRPTSQTVADTLKWLAQRPADQPWRAGISTERELGLLRLWKSHRQELP